MLLDLSTVLRYPGEEVLLKKTLLVPHKTILDEVAHEEQFSREMVRDQIYFLMDHEPD